MKWPPWTWVRSGRVWHLVDGRGYIVLSERDDGLLLAFVHHWYVNEEGKTYTPHVVA